MKSFGEVIAELRLERALTPESVSFADQEKRRGRYRDRLHQRYRARPQKPALARFRGAIGGGVGSTTGGSPVLRRTAPVGRETGRSVASADCGSLPRFSEGDRQTAEVTMKEHTRRGVSRVRSITHATSSKNRVRRSSWASAWGAR